MLKVPVQQTFDIFFLKGTWRVCSTFLTTSAADFLKVDDHNLTERQTATQALPVQRRSCANVRGS